jgi:hypothetical protein
MWPLKAFFANWLDGTVPRRNELLTRIQKIDEATAETTLKELGIRYENPKFAKAILEKSVASIQSSEKVTAVERAVSKAQSEKGIDER